MPDSSSSSAARPGRDDRGRRRRGVLRHYHRPLWKDRLFWLVAIPSVLATGAFFALVLVVSGVPASPVGWLRPALLSLVVLLLAFRLLGAGVTTSRHFQRGLGEGSAPRPNDLEAKGRAAGAAVGRAVQAARGTPVPPQPEPEPESERPESRANPTAANPAAAAPAPTASAPTVPAPSHSTSAPAAASETVDRAARVMGSMMGRRLAERRQRADDD